MRDLSLRGQQGRSARATESRLSSKMEDRLISRRLANASFRLRSPRYLMWPDPCRLVAHRQCQITGPDTPWEKPFRKRPLWCATVAPTGPPSRSRDPLAIHPGTVRSSLSCYHRLWLSNYLSIGLNTEFRARKMNSFARSEAGL